MGVAIHDRESVADWSSRLPMYVPVAALTDSDRHQGRTVKYVQCLKQKSAVHKIMA